MCDCRTACGTAAMVPGKDGTMGYRSITWCSFNDGTRVPVPAYAVPLCTTLTPNRTTLYRNLAHPAQYPTQCGSTSRGGLPQDIHEQSQSQIIPHCTPSYTAPYHTLYPTPCQCETPYALTSSCSLHRIMYHIVYHHNLHRVHSL